jgi:hypothetical protein
VKILIAKEWTQYHWFSECDLTYCTSVCPLKMIWNKTPHVFIANLWTFLINGSSFSYHIYIYILYIYIYTQSQCNPSNFKISEKSLVYCSIRTKSPNQIKSDGPGQCSVSPNNVQTGASPGVFKPLNCCLFFKLLSLSNSPAVDVSLLPNFISSDGWPSRVGKAAP